MRGIQSYRRSAIEGASNEEILVMLLEAAIRREEAADAAMERGDRRAWVGEIHIARAIFLELRIALDHSLVPEVTAGLDRTYRWCVHHLTAVARSGDRAGLEKVRQVTGVIHATWVEALKIARAEQAGDRGTPESAA